MVENAYFLKVIVIGDSGVGKTSILNQFAFERFDSDVPPTIGCDFSTKVLKDYKGKKTIRIQLWDIAGQDRYKGFSKMYIRGAVGCIIVCDYLCENTLESTLKWREIVEDSCDRIDGNPIPILLLQNKVDLAEGNKKTENFMKKEYLEKFAKENKFIGSFQTSAKKNINVKESIEFLTDEIIKRNLIPESSVNYDSMRGNSHVLHPKKVDTTPQPYNIQKCQC